MTGEKGSQVLTFIAEFLRINDSNRLNKFIIEPFIVMCQKKLNALAEEDLKKEKEYQKEIEELKSQINNLNATINYLTAESTEVISEKASPPQEVISLEFKNTKKDVSDETVDEVMKEVKKK